MIPTLIATALSVMSTSSAMQMSTCVWFVRKVPGSWVTVA